MRARPIPLVLLVAACLAPLIAHAQEGRNPYSFDQVLQLVSAGVGAPLILGQVAETCISFRIDQDAELRLRTSGADSTLIEGLRSTCFVAPPQGTVATRSYSPGGAAIRSLLIPGFGQLYTERPLLGVAFLAAATGAVAAGATSGSETVYCAQPTTGSCPPDMVIDRQSSSNLLLGIAGGAAVAAAAAVEAYLNARHRNARVVEARAPGRVFALSALLTTSSDRSILFGATWRF